MPKKSLAALRDTSNPSAEHGLIHLSRDARARLAVMLLISLALHAVLLAFLRFHEFAINAPAAPLNATLVPLKPVEPAAPPAPPPPRRVVAHHVSPPAHDVPTAEPEPVSPLATRDAGPALESSGDGSSASPASTAPAASASGAGTIAASSAPAGKPPASAVLRYDAVARDPKRDANQSYAGTGLLEWKRDASSYTLNFSVQAIILFVKLDYFQLHSSGTLDEAGLAPLRYSESSRNHAPAELDFGAGNAQRHLQDRLSVMLQLGSLMRANPTLAQPGTELSFDALDPSGALETWRFRVVGTESIRTDAGEFSAVHVSKVLRPGSNDRGIDLWLAPTQGDYPVRILYTEPNQSYIDLRLARVS